MSNNNPNEIDEFKTDIVRAVMAGIKPEAGAKPRWTEYVQTFVPAVLLMIAGIGGWVNMSSQIQTVATTQINRSQDIATNKADIQGMQAKQAAVEERLRVIEYQNTTSIQDRKEFRDKLDATNQTVSGISDRLTRIEAGVQQLIDARKNK